MQFLIGKPYFRVVLFCIHWGHSLSLIFASSSHSCHRQFNKLKLHSIFWPQMWDAQHPQSYQALLHMKLTIHNTVDNSIEIGNNCRCTVTAQTRWRNWELWLMQYHLLNVLFLFWTILLFSKHQSENIAESIDVNKLEVSKVSSCMFLCRQRTLPIRFIEYLWHMVLPSLQKYTRKERVILLLWCFFPVHCTWSRHLLTLMRVFSMQVLPVWIWGKWYYRFRWILGRDGWGDPAEQIDCQFNFLSL